MGSNFFNVVDIDGIVVTTGWLVVGNSTHEIQNCSIDGTGQTRFWWVKTIPYEYNYTLYAVSPVGDYLLDIKKP